MNESTRTEAAEAVAERINESEDHGARVWIGESSVRVYLKLNRGRRGWADNGSINFNRDGSVDVQAARQASVAKDAVREFLAVNTILSTEQVSSRESQRSEAANQDDENDFLPT